MVHFALVLWIAAAIAFGFPSEASAATNEDLIAAAKKEREVVFYTTTNLEEAAAMSDVYHKNLPSFLAPS